jgi:hypothetical protein
VGDSEDSEWRQTGCEGVLEWVLSKVSSATVADSRAAYQEGGAGLWRRRRRVLMREHGRGKLRRGEARAPKRGNDENMLGFGAAQVCDNV